jgi:hypothetical protein
MRGIGRGARQTFSAGRTERNGILTGRNSDFVGVSGTAKLASHNDILFLKLAPLICPFMAQVYRFSP